MFKVVALVLKIVAVPVVPVVMSLPFNAKSPFEVILPVAPSTEKLVPAILLTPSEIPVTIVGSERSIPVVIPPPPEEEIVKPTGSARSVSALSMRTSCVGSFVPFPSARWKIVEPVEPSAVVMVKFASVAVFSSEKAMSFALVVSIVLPPSYADWREIALDAHLVI